jgi:hypothetical protein
MIFVSRDSQEDEVFFRRTPLEMSEDDEEECQDNGGGRHTVYLSSSRPGPMTDPAETIGRTDRKWRAGLERNVCPLSNPRILKIRRQPSWMDRNHGSSSARRPSASKGHFPQSTHIYGEKRDVLALTKSTRFVRLLDRRGHSIHRRRRTRSLPSSHFLSSIHSFIPFIHRRCYFVTYNYHDRKNIRFFRSTNLSGTDSAESRGSRRNRVSDGPRDIDVR